MEETSHKPFFLGLIALVLTGCIIIFAYMSISGINNRLIKLESLASQHTGELAEVRTWAFPASMLEGKFKTLNTRMQALANAFTALEDKLTAVMSQQQAVTTAAMVAMETRSGVQAGTGKSSAVTGKEPAVHTENSGPVENAGEAAGMDEVELASVAISEPVVKDTQQAVSAKREVPGARDAGPWVINLLSSRRKIDTERLAIKAQSQDIPVEQTRAMVKGKAYWRLQVTGFSTLNEAKSHAGAIKE
ncbi:MAG: SPOR domain-containing protein, partial [Pseudomonadota bacterium]|nr:SPOR domain-containing protein [Pseudomonadota bacterium]